MLAAEWIETNCQWSAEARPRFYRIVHLMNLIGVELKFREMLTQCSIVLPSSSGLSSVAGFSSMRLAIASLPRSMDVIAGACAGHS